MIFKSKLTLVVAISAALFFSIGAQAAAKKKANAKMDLDTTASSVKWTGAKAIGSAHSGEVKVKEGYVELTGGKIVGGNVVIDMSTVTNTDLKDTPDYQKKLVEHLTSEDFFNVKKYPTATFKILSTEKKSDTEYTLKGELTMVGETKPLDVSAKIMVKGETVTGEAKMKIDRTKWGLKYGSGNFFKELTGDKIINDEFELDLKLAAKSKI
jgi:polyisoprenoid-binding protein YceI